jgi:hypothetical protein
MLRPVRVDLAFAGRDAGPPVLDVADAFATLPRFARRAMLVRGQVALAGAAALLERLDGHLAFYRHDLSLNLDEDSLDPARLGRVNGLLKVSLQLGPIHRTIRLLQRVFPKAHRDNRIVGRPEQFSPEMSLQSLISFTTLSP